MYSLTIDLISERNRLQDIETRNLLCLQILVLVTLLDTHMIEKIMFVLIQLMIEKKECSFDEILSFFLFLSTFVAFECFSVRRLTMI